MSTEKITVKTEDFWNREHVVEKFWKVLNARLELEDRKLKYVCGEVELDEGPAINAVILGINRKKAKTIQNQLPIRVRPVFYDMDRYTTLFFELDED